MTTIEANAERIFADARHMRDAALERLAAGDLRDAAEKAWCATVRATEALVLIRTGQEPGTSTMAGRRLQVPLRGRPSRIERSSHTLLLMIVRKCCTANAFTTTTASRWWLNASSVGPQTTYRTLSGWPRASAPAPRMARPCAPGDTIPSGKVSDRRWGQFRAHFGRPTIRTQPPKCHIMLGSYIR